MNSVLDQLHDASVLRVAFTVASLPQDSNQSEAVSDADRIHSYVNTLL